MKKVGVLILVVTLSLLQFQTPVFAALSSDQKKALSEGVKFFNVEDGTSICTAAGSSVLTGQDNRAKVFNFFLQKGLNPTESAGIFGNLATESGDNISPIAEEKLGQDKGGKGIAQWTATRRITFEAAATAAGVITRQAQLAAIPAADQPAVLDKALKFNLDYLWTEATNRGDLDKLKQESSSLTNAVASWERWFEGALNPNVALRLQKAQKGFDEFGNNTSGDVSVDSTVGSATGVGGCQLTGNSDSNKVIQVALSQVGMLETNSDCNKYFDGRAKCTSTPWCAAFTRWVFGQAGFTVGGGDRAKGVGQWFNDNKTFFKWQEPYHPLPGDVIVKGRGGSGTGWSGDGHIGIVIEVNGFSITTVEGNAGNTVKKVSYSDYRKIPELIGFGRYVDKGTVQPDPNFNPLTGAGAQNAITNEL